MSVAFLVALSLAAPPEVAAGLKPAPTECAAVVDRTVALVDQAVDVLAAEKQKKGNPDTGVAALAAWVTAHREAVDKERLAATALQATLTQADRDKCALYSQNAFHRVLTRVSDLGAFYADRVEMWRLLGDLFR